MPDWQDPTIVLYCSFVYDSAGVFLLGFFGHHVMGSMEIEWSLITRARKFSFMLIPYLLGRYTLLYTLIAFVISSAVKLNVACDAYFRSLVFFGALASVCSTLNLSTRAFMLWKDMNLAVVWILGFGSVVHFGLVLLQTVESITVVRVPATNSCAVIKSNNITMFIFYLYTILMELAILIMTIVGLLKKGALATRIGCALSEQCVWYCAGSFLCTVPAVVFPIMNLNPIMNVIASVPATTFCVMMSSAAVLLLKSDDWASHMTTESLPSAPIDGGRGALDGVIARRGSSNGVFTTNIALESLPDSEMVTSFRSRCTKTAREEDITAMRDSPV